MRRLALAALLLAVAPALLGQSLAEVADKNKAKKKDPKAKTFTNDDLDKIHAAQPTPSPTPKGAKPTKPFVSNWAESEGVLPGDSDGQEQVAPPTGEASSEPYWRKRFEEARDKIKEAEKRASDLQARYTALASDMNPNPADIGDPMRVFNLDEKKRQTLQELEQAKADVAAAKRALEDLQDQARRKAVPPGWVRED